MTILVTLTRRERAGRPVRDGMLVEKCDHTLSKSPVRTRHSVRCCVPNGTHDFVEASVFYPHYNGTTRTWSGCSFFYQHSVPNGTLDSSLSFVFYPHSVHFGRLNAPPNGTHDFVEASVFYPHFVPNGTPNTSPNGTLTSSRFIFSLATNH